MQRIKRSTVRLISFLTAVILTLTAWGAVNAVALKRARCRLRADNERSLTELGAYLDEIALDLQKCRYVSTAAMMNDLTAEIRRASTAAKTALSALTGSADETAGLYKFLAQTGEYGVALSKRLSAGGEWRQEDRDTVRRLGDTAGKLSGEIRYLLEEEEEGLLGFDEVKSTLLQEADAQKLVLATELTDVSQTVKGPTLLYDGPFSDNVGTKKSELLKDLAAVTESEARKTAAAFAACRESDLQLLGEVRSNIDLYTFYSPTVTVSVTVKGGVVSYLLSSRAVGESKLAPEDAVKRAAAFLEKHGYRQIKSSYYAVNDGVCTVNFATLQGEAICYTDLIKVSVALDDGGVVGFDATGYLMNHRKRAVPTDVALSRAGGVDLLRDDLRVEEVREAFIPSDFETEYYVYEYHCFADDGTELLVYLDPRTGAEREVLIMLHTDGGVLTK